MRVFLFLLLLPSLLNAQNVYLQDVWGVRQGDFPKEKIAQINQTGQLELQYNQLLTLRFGSDNPKEQLRYQITPHDVYGNWRDLGTGGMLQLPLLPGDDYVLAVSNGQNTCKIRLAISQTIIQKWWFWLSVAVYVVFLVGILAYFFSLYTLRQKLKVQQIRNQIAADLHDEVGSNLNSIAIFVELLRKKAPAELSDILDKIKNNSTESVQLMQDTIWAIQSKNDGFQTLLDKMKNNAATMLSIKNISLSFDNQIDSSNISLTMGQRKNVYLIFKEALNNIVKHSNALKVSVKCRMENEKLVLTIADNGRGFDTSEVFEGNGLYNFESRAQAEEMQLRIDSTIGTGTTITLVIDPA